jgi:hypothetical protein
MKHLLFIAGLTITGALRAQGVDSTARDSAAVRRVAAVALKADSATIAAAQLTFKGDTAWVRTGDRVSWNMVRVERRKGEWVATPGVVYGIR